MPAWPAPVVSGEAGPLTRRSAASGGLPDAARARGAGAACRPMHRAGTSCVPRAALLRQTTPFQLHRNRRSGQARAWKLKARDSAVAEVPFAANKSLGVSRGRSDGQRRRNRYLRSGRGRVVVEAKVKAMTTAGHEDLRWC